MILDSLWPAQALSYPSTGVSAAQVAASGLWV